ncbi:MAG TPA: response regulator [Nitrososphaeraceae archaeon]|nr:response regulator [Nitrososphaeraceae archaeon]
MTHTYDVLNKNNIVSIVDNETETAQLLLDVLHTISGINVFKFTDPSMALEHFKTNKEDYALMISNLRLPVINGVQLLKTVKDLNPSVRTVLITEYEINDEILQEYNKNEIINSFIKKPFKHDEIISELNDQVSYMKSINKK